MVTCMAADPSDDMKAAADEVQTPVRPAAHDDPKEINVIEEECPQDGNESVKDDGAEETTTMTTECDDVGAGAYRRGESWDVTEKNGKEGGDDEVEECARERLKRHRTEMAGRVWIPEIWGQEKLLRDWSDCAKFDTSLVPQGLVSARDALVAECRRLNPRPPGLQVHNSC